MAMVGWRSLVTVAAVALLAWALGGWWGGRKGDPQFHRSACNSGNDKISDGDGGGGGGGGDGDGGGGVLEDEEEQFWAQEWQQRRIKFSSRALEDLQQHPASIPVILEDAPITTLAPCFRWTLASLTRRMQQPVPVKYQASPEFLYFNEGMPFDKASQEYGAKPFIKQHQEVLASLTTVLNESRWGSKGGQHRYVAGPAEVLLDTGLQRDIASLRRVAVTASGEEEVHTNVWITNNSTTAALHYDTSTNVYAVIEGKKTFSVLPPRFLHRVLFHSTLHPLYRQAAEPWGDVLSSFGPQVQPLTIKRGELLYLPPYWLHRVQSHGWSLAANVWSNSPDFIASERCFKLPLPFDSSWPNHKLLSKTVTYLSALNRRVNPRRAILCDRCRVEDAFAQTRCSDTTYSSRADQPMPSLEESELNRLESLAACFHTIRDAHVRLLYLHNFVEQTSRLVAGTNALSFLRCQLLPALNSPGPR